MQKPVGASCYASSWPAVSQCVPGAFCFSATAAYGSTYYGTCIPFNSLPAGARFTVPFGSTYAAENEVCPRAPFSHALAATQAPLLCAPLAGPLHVRFGAGCCPARRGGGQRVLHHRSLRRSVELGLGVGALPRLHTHPRGDASSRRGRVAHVLPHQLLDGAAAGGQRRHEVLPSPRPQRGTGVGRGGLLWRRPSTMAEVAK